MATEDDTFDIDIYGDEPNEAQQAEPQGANGDEYELDFSTTADDVTEQSESTTRVVASGEQVDIAQATMSKQTTSKDSPQQQGTKRKAPDDGYPEEREDDYGTEQYAADDFADSLDAKHGSTGDPYAMPALKLTELQWWTTEEDLRGYCAKAGVENQLKELSFGEHKINGKSRGEAYLEFGSASAAEKVKNEFERAVAASQSESGSKRKDWLIEYSHPGNGFRMAAGATLPKKDYQQQGAYNNRGGYNNDNRGRGNFRGGNYNNRGGGFNNRGGMYQQSNPSQGGWGGGNSMVPNMGGGFNPMMGMMPNMANFNMGMGRGGFNNMNGMSMGRGGMNMGMNMGMMGRGGWNNGGFQGGQGNGMGQQGWHGGGGGGGMQGGNKRAKME